jgi:hypothetical protein
VNARPVVFVDNPDWRLRSRMFEWVPSGKTIDVGDFWGSAGPEWVPVLLEPHVGFAYARTTATAAGCQYEKVMPDRLILPA